MTHTTNNEAVSADSVALMEGAVAIVKAYLLTNQLPHDRVPDFIREVYNAISAPLIAQAMTTNVAAADEAAEPAETVEVGKTELSKVPFCPIDESIKKDVLVCLFDGVEKKMLKRHLRAKYNMEWDEYVAHFDLPTDYPSVAPGYAETKRQEALKIGLGSTIDKTPKTFSKREDALLAVAA